MTKLTPGAHIILAVTINAASHRRTIGYFGYDIHLCYLAVAHFAGHSGIEMGPMIPVNPTWQNVDASPWNRCGRLRKLGQL
jgi:hypothetical protein